jgi:uncharacterized protein (DUF608 family)
MDVRLDREGYRGRIYDETCTQAAFLVGGIGTGDFSVGARGELKDWEIFETSGKGNFLPNTFFAIRTDDGMKVDARVLEAEIQPPYSKSHGFYSHEVAGLPRFRHSAQTAEYPFVQVRLEDDGFPASVELEAFNPFIPLNADDSGLPIGILRYAVTNRSDKPLAVSVMGSLNNMSTFKAFQHHTWGFYDTAGDGVNEYRDEGGLRGLYFHPKTLSPKDRYYGTLALATREAPEHVSHKRAWLNGGWWDGLQDAWDDFAGDGRLEAESHYVCRDSISEHRDETGSLCIAKNLAPGGTATFEFLLSWHFPHRVDSWSERMGHAEAEKKSSCGCGPGGCPPPESDGSTSGFDLPLIRKYYATRHEDAWAVADYVAHEMPRLEGDSRRFRGAFFGSTLPEAVIDAVSANITVLRSPTCFRLEDGTLMAWEGCFSDDGCCEGSCTHVWNYAQTVAFLFPELERTMRRNEYLLETQADGKMNFRSYQRFHMGPHDHVPAADGQLGTFLRLYREWMLSGDEAFLREVWPAAKSTLDMAFSVWDKDGDGVLDTDQFNTYDISFQGPSSLVNSLFLGALLAGERMARHLGEGDCADRWHAAFVRGSAATDAMLWDECAGYYVQRVDDVNAYRYQYGLGCLSDQLFGQTLAHVAGLGHVLPEDHVRAAIHAVFEHNFLSDPRSHVNLQRTYRLNDERGLLLCTWPNGGRPNLPFPYSDEVWTGIEYQVATHLAFEGFTEEALTLVQALRARHDGIRRNPWNEVECGHHYARAMASYGLWVAFSGYRFDVPDGWISFDPKVSADDFSCFFSTGTGWGVFRRTIDATGTVQQDLEWLYGTPGGVSLRG